MRTLPVLPSADPTLPACRWRGRVLPTGRYPCDSKKLVVGPAGVTAELCRSKCPWVDHEPVVGAPPRPAPPPAEGPGTELKALLAALGLTAGGCACDRRAGEMNAWGVAGCRRRREEIAGWLREQAGRRGWAEKVAAGIRAVATGLALKLDPADVYGSLVDLAVANAELGG